MKEPGWSLVMGTRMEQNITKLGHNLHLYLTWFFLHLKAETISQEKKKGNSPNLRTLSIKWTPYISGRDPAGYMEILLTIRNLIQNNIIAVANIEYISFEGEEDNPIAYTSYLLNKETMEKIDIADMNQLFGDKKFEGVRFYITINDTEAFPYINECLGNWKSGNFYHYKHDLFPPKKQTDILLQKLREKFELYEHMPFILDLSEFPNEIDGFCALLELEKAGIIRLYNFRKKLESEDLIPKTFQIAILKAPRGHQETGSSDHLIFNKKNGRVVFGEKIISIITVGTLPYLFFEILFDNIDSVVTHEQIGKHLKDVVLDETTNALMPKIEKSLPNYISDIKSRLPKGIKELVSGVKGGYIIDTTKIVREK